MSDHRSHGTVEILIEGADLDELENSIDENMSVEDYFSKSVFQHLEKDLDVEFEGIVVDAGGT